MGCDILASRFITRKLAFSIELSSNLANFYFKIIEHDRPSNLPALHRYIQSFRQSKKEGKSIYVQYVQFLNFGKHFCGFICDVTAFIFVKKRKKVTLAKSEISF